MAKYLVFTTHIYGSDPTEQRIDLSAKTATVYSNRHPKKGTVVITKYFLEAFGAYVNPRLYIRNAIHTNYVDVDSVLKVYKDIMAHEEELLMHLMLGGDI